MSRLNAHLPAGISLVVVGVEGRKEFELEAINAIPLISVTVDSNDPWEVIRNDADVGANLTASGSLIAVVTVRHCKGNGNREDDCG